MNADQILNWREGVNEEWIEQNKCDLPFAAGALAYISGHGSAYGCHYGMRSTREWAMRQFKAGWEAAQRDCGHGWQWMGDEPEEWGR